MATDWTDASMIRRALRALLATLVLGGVLVWQWGGAILLPSQACSIAGAIPSVPRPPSPGSPAPTRRPHHPANAHPTSSSSSPTTSATTTSRSAGGGVAHGAVPTPRIDSIARDGVEFTHGYAGNATCAPSRAAIMTGRYPTRFGFEFTPAPKQFMRLVVVSPAERSRCRRRTSPTARPRCHRSSSRACRRRRSRSRELLRHARLPHARARQVAPRRGAGDVPDRARASTNISGFLQGAAMYLPKDDPAAVNAQPGLRPDRPVPVGEPLVQRPQGRRPALHARRLHDGLPRSRGGAARSPRTRTGRSSSTSRSTRRTRRCRRSAGRLRRATADREPHAARLRRR